MIDKFIKISALIVFIVLIAGCNKEVACQMNGLAIDDNLIGVDRNYILTKLGQPEYSAIAIKGFDEFTFSVANKSYAIILRYELKNSDYYASSQKCLKTRARLEISNRVIWH